MGAGVVTIRSVLQGLYVKAMTGVNAEACVYAEFMLRSYFL